MKRKFTIVNKNSVVFGNKMLLYFSVFVMQILFAPFSYSQEISSRFFKSYQYVSDEGFESPETFFYDINDSGVIVGSFVNATGGTSALVLFPNGKTYTYNHESYTTTEFMGINNEGKIVGRAHNGNPSEALPIIGIVTVVEGVGNFYASSYGLEGINTFREPQKINDNNFCAGTFRSTGNYRWINFELQEEPWTQASIIYSEGQGSSFTQYNTYGLGLNNLNEVSGFYLNGSQYYPLIYNYPGTNPSNFHTPAQYNPDGIPQAGTKINDINDDGFVVVEYKGAGNIWQGCVGFYDPISNSINYQSQFPFHTAEGSSALGINNNKDYVGYYFKDGIRMAFAAYTDPRMLLGVSSSDWYGENFTNDDINFRYSSSAYVYDYSSEDPYTGDQVNFIENYMNMLGMSFCCSMLDSFNAGQMYPSWKSYVLAQTSQRVYENVNGMQIPKLSEIAKWMAISDTAFRGNCLGMSLFAGQFMIDNAINTARFPGLLFLDSLIEIDNNTLSSFQKQDVKEAIAACQIYSKKPSFNSIDHENLLYFYLPFQYAMSEAEYAERFDSIYAINTKFYDQFYASLDPDHEDYSILGLEFYDVAGRHAVFPIGVSRYVDLNLRIDTIFVHDPNYPQEVLMIEIDYDNFLVNAYVGNEQVYINELGQSEIAVAYAATTIRSLELEDNTGFKPLSSSGTANKSTHNGYDIYLKKLCDYKIEDINDANIYIEKTGATLNNNMPGVETILDYNDDNLPDMLRSYTYSGVKAMLQNCASTNNWLYAHPEGDMIMSRGDVALGETDIVYNQGNYMKIENPDAIEKHIKFGTLSDFTGEESAVVFDSFTLASGDTVALEAMDQYHFKLLNGLDNSNHYDLFVRYLSSDQTFTWNMSNVQISANTNHIVVLQPDVPGQEVIILVDVGQDGSIDETIVEEPTGIKPIIEDWNVKLFPIPAIDILNIETSHSLPKGTLVKLYNAEGKLLHQSSVGSKTEIAIPLSGMSSGMYLIKLENQNYTIWNGKFIKK